MIEEKIAKILSVILKKEISPNDDVSMENCYEWDSMKHIEIIVTIEDELGVSFIPEDIPQMTTMQKIIQKVKELTK